MSAPTEQAELVTCLSCGEKLPRQLIDWEQHACDGRKWERSVAAAHRRWRAAHPQPQPLPCDWHYVEGTLREAAKWNDLEMLRPKDPSVHFWRGEGWRNR